MGERKPSIGELWNQAGGDGEKYRDLMLAHGYLITCPCSCHEDGSGHCEACKPKLPCGWDGARA